LIAAFEPAKLLVFGSRARGEGLATSDLDLMIVSDAFRNVPWLERPVRVLESLGLTFGVDLLCYTPDEYERKRQELGIFQTASETGLVLVGSPTS
jgi:hypothetical protein